MALFWRSLEPRLRVNRPCWLTSVSTYLTKCLKTQRHCCYSTISRNEIQFPPKYVLPLSSSELNFEQLSIASNSKLQIRDLNFRKYSKFPLIFIAETPRKTFYIKPFLSHHRRCFSHAHRSRPTPLPPFFLCTSHPSCASPEGDDPPFSPHRRLPGGVEEARKTKTLQTVEEENETWKSRKIGAPSGNFSVQLGEKIPSHSKQAKLFHFLPQLVMCEK